MSEDLAYMSATELVRRFRDKSLSPVEATEAALARIDSDNDKINAFNVLDPERALAQARRSEARWQHGDPAGAVDGVPTSIKDLVLSDGWPTMRGSRTTDPAGPWDTDAPAVARLREHGAVFIGKTTTPEFGWKGITDSPLTGITRNPWNLAKTPGGSSGGGTAALAAGMGALAIGSDGGGSIRIPCGFTGVFGIKAQFGRVPAWPPSAMGTLSHVGPMARSVADAALMLNVMAEPDARDWSSIEYVKHDYGNGLDRGVKGLRVAYSPDLGYAKVHPEVAAAVAEAAKTFESLGAYVEQIDPGFADPTEDFRTLWWAGAAAAMGDFSAEQKAVMEPPLAELVEEGKSLTAVQLQKAVNARFALGTHMRVFHMAYDLLLTPALAVPAFDVGTLAPEGWEGTGHWLKWTPFSYPFNMTQQPACSVPCGFTSDRLPVGLQIVADTYREDLVLRAAAAFEATQPAVTWPGQV
ncbi:MAG: amidase [Alphaproteobacteria bacterium]